MCIDEPGKNSGTAKVDEVCALRQRMRARRIDFDYAVPADDDVLIASDLRACAVDEHLGSNDRGGLLRDAKARNRKRRFLRVIYFTSSISVQNPSASVG